MKKTTKLKHYLSALRTWARREGQAPRVRIMRLLAERSLEPVFQPLVDLRSGVLLGHEALIRAPRSLEVSGFDVLLQAAQTERCQKNFELACLELAMQQWTAQSGKDTLFVNISAATLVQLQESDASGMLLHLMRKHNMSPRRMGLDISGYTRVPQLEVLIQALRPLRDAGVTIALDDFKASENSMKVWAKVLPNVIKMAPRWTHNIGVDAEQGRVVSSLVRLTRNHNALLVAKSVETEAELRALQALGVDMAQGYFLGSPAEAPVRSLNLRAREVLRTPEATPARGPQATVPGKPAKPPVLDTRYQLLH
ncbi:EAL domain-containing protein [Rhodoferax bucti]|uniref:EAL domain-containing protein n=1 Tax=Rhodoferax bucti TaxID=2576305 RepID=UPI0014768C2A|nr:EAL domain-containing protein [Rhodoferax bucti]